MPKDERPQYVVQVRDNSESRTWQTTDALREDVPQLNRTTGWTKYRVVPNPAISIEEHVARFGVYEPYGGAGATEWAKKYQQAYDALRALRFGAEAEEIINLVYEHRNSNTRLAKVREYLASLVGDATAAAEAEADAERQKFAEHAFTVPRERRAAETTVTVPLREGDENTRIARGGERKRYVGPWPDRDEEGHVKQ
jgi:hypothetical protein